MGGRVVVEGVRLRVIGIGVDLGTVWVILEGVILEGRSCVPRSRGRSCAKCQGYRYEGEEEEEREKKRTFRRITEKRVLAVRVHTLSVRGGGCTRWGWYWDRRYRGDHGSIDGSSVKFRSIGVFPDSWPCWYFQRKGFGPISVNPDDRASEQQSFVSGVVASMIDEI